MASVNSNFVPPEAQQGIQKMPAQSSWIAEFEYDPQSLRLTTYLRDGSIYQHTFVTKLDWEALKTSKNHSQHWAKGIKGQKLGIRIKSAKSPNSKARR